MMGLRRPLRQGEGVTSRRVPKPTLPSRFRRPRTPPPSLPTPSSSRPRRRSEKRLRQKNPRHRFHVHQHNSHDPYEERQDLVNGPIGDMTITVDTLEDSNNEGDSAGEGQQDDTAGYSIQEVEEMKYHTERLRAERNKLAELCAGLKTSLLSTRKDMGIAKTKNTLAMSNLQVLVDSLKEDRQCLMEKCQSMERNVASLRMECEAKQQRIDSLETQVDANKRLSMNIRSAHGLEKKVIARRHTHSDTAITTINSKEEEDR